VTDIPFNGRATASTLVQCLFLVFSAIGTILTLGWVLWYCRYGIDFTDESYYLIWISNPFKYGVSVTQFGFIYHPLYELVGGNISNLRQTNILITYCLSWTLGNVFLRTILGIQSLHSTTRFVISGSIATASMASLIYAGMWLPTPSYNTLAFQALLVTATGLLLASKHFSSSSVLGWFLIGVGGWLAFMAKPTTAAALAVCTGFYLLFARKLSFRLLAMSIAAAAGFTALAAYIIDGSIIAFIDRLKDGAEMSRTLDAGTNIADLLRRIDFRLGEFESLSLIGGAAVVVLCTLFSQVDTKALVRGDIAVSVAFALTSVAIGVGTIDNTFLASKIQSLFLWAVTFMAILGGISVYRFKALFLVSRPQWALLLMFLVIPYCYAFGSTSSYAVFVAKAGIFGVLGGLVLLSPIASNAGIRALLLPLVLAVQMIVVTLIYTSMAKPYLQSQPLRENDYKLEIGTPGSVLVLSRGAGQYIADAIDLANRAHFKKGTPTIDLSGQSPGILYAIGASPTGDAWINGGYRGSENYAVASLKRASCEELSVAWLLAEPNGPLEISPRILNNFGSDIVKDYEIVGTLRTAKGAGGYKQIRVQQLLRPLRSFRIAFTACINSRKSQQ